MRVTDVLTDLPSSSWLSFKEAVLDPTYGYILSLKPVDFGIKRDGTDRTYTTIAGDLLPNIVNAAYGTVNYTPLVFMLNDCIESPLYLPPNLTIWLPNQTKIYNFLRDFNLSQ